MTLTDQMSLNLSNFIPTPPVKAGADRSWTSVLRQAAAARFAALGFPGTRQEDWRFTNVSPIARTEFQPPPLRHDVSAAMISPYLFGQMDCNLLVFVNGRYEADLSNLPSQPKGVRIRSLAEALRRDESGLVEKHLAHLARYDNSPFNALNTAHLADGAFVHLSADVKVDRPIHLLFVSTGGERPTVSYPRVLIVAEERSEAAIIESYAGIGRPGPYFTNAVTELQIGDGCRIEHCKAQREDINAFHIATLSARLGREVKFRTHNLNFGGSLVRNDIGAVLAGQHAECTLDGLAVIGGRQHVDNNTLIDHANPNCASHELYKHILDGNAAAVFRGTIHVAPDAQKTDAKQTNRTLLLSDSAMINTMPQLKIYADDVKCTHGATIGQLDEEHLFYLRSRGIPADQAKRLLTYAFAARVTSRIPIEPVRKTVEEMLLARHGFSREIRGEIVS